MTVENPKHHFVCLPFLNMGELPEIDLGFAKVWNFDLKKQDYIQDTALRNQVERILKNYRMSHPFGRTGMDAYPPIYGIGIIDISKSTEQEFDDLDREKINDARLILFISYLSRNNTVTRNVNTGHSMVSTENFAPVYFSAVTDSDNMSEHTGFVVPMIHGGIDIDANIIIRQRHIPTPSYNIDNNLAGYLLKTRIKQKRKFRKMMAAIEVFAESHYNTVEVSHNARILLQASSFEILLDLQGDFRKAFKDYLNNHASYAGEKKIRYSSERKNGQKDYEVENRKVMWADRFFTLRNHIIHGEVPKQYEYSFGGWQRHFDIAVLFFILCLKLKIEECLKRELFEDDVEWKTWIDDHHVEPQKYTGFEYTYFGRRGWERILAKLR